MEIIIVVVLVIVGWVSISKYLDKKRRKALFEKYGDPEIVDRIIRKMFWQGQTQAQLVDALGRPVEIDKNVLKTKTKEIWKYSQIGKGRYALRITLENGLVGGWDKKS